jgi:dTDP-4-dehydrorhamnose 3,5-epimerase
MHCHPLHDDYVSVLSGRLRIVLADGRASSGTFREVAWVELDEHEPMGIVIPIGVAHAFEAVGPVTFLYGLDDLWNPSIDFGCSWRDPHVRGAFVSVDPMLSARDRDAGSFDDMVDDFNRFLAARAEPDDRAAATFSSGR